MLPVVGSTWLAGYGYQPFRVETTEITFQYSRKAAGTKLNGCKSSNISAVWTPCHQETLINGVLQGRKQTDPKGASALSRARMCMLLLETVSLIDVPALRYILKVSSYLDMKNLPDLKHRRRVKEEVKSESLKGWNS